jgi:hypothetical protein
MSISVRSQPLGGDTPTTRERLPIRSLKVTWSE